MKRRSNTIDNPLFEINQLRNPVHMLDSMTRKQLEKICEKHKKLDEYFLDNYI